EVAPGGESTVSGFVTLLAVAQALASVNETSATLLPKNILFAFFQGLYRVTSGELQPVAHTLTVASKKTQPRRNGDPLIATLLQTSGYLWDVPMCSLSRAPSRDSHPDRSARAHPCLFPTKFPAVRLARGAMAPLYHESSYDTADNLRLKYPSGMTPEQQLEFVTDTAQALSEVATVVARALYKHAGGSDADLSNIQADPKTVTQMLYGFLIQSNNSWFRSLVSPDRPSDILEDRAPQYYVAVNTPVRSTQLVKYVLANLTGTVTNLTKEQCQSPEQGTGESKE
uniref:Nicastrin n=1 Tax=Lepisosteus oculatus TaxID=7918 RepID=W5M1B7_LEPOC